VGGAFLRGVDALARVDLLRRLKQVEHLVSLGDGTWAKIGMNAVSISRPAVGRPAGWIPFRAR
jgi:hypothetical protein